MNTPRKKKLKKTIASQKKKIKRLQNTMKRFSTKKVREESLDEALAKLPDNLAQFVKLQLQLHSKKKKGRRYSPEMKSIAVSLYHASGKAYRILAKLFILPTKSSLQRYVSKMPTSAGISQASLNIIKKKVSSMSEQEKLCTLCMDEISLKTHLYYDNSRDRIIGLEDFGDGIRSNKLANSGFVLLLRSISGKWKQPIGYALVNGACPTDEMERIMKDAIEKVESIGLNVVVVLSDMGSNFQSLAIHLGITPEKPWFMHNGKKYYLMFDPPHLMKCVRNNLMKYTIKFDEYVAQWKDIKAFYDKDRELSIRAAPKLTDRHICPNNFEKMKVKYATQILSHTVAASLCMYVSVGAISPSAIGTAEFLSKFDALFDCVNSSTIKSTKELKCGLTNTTSHLSFLKEMYNFIAKLKVFDGNVDVTGRIRCLKGWLVSINAITLIWNHLQEKHAFKFLLTRRLNTDPLENFFDSIRQQGGNSDSPTPIQFTRAFRKLFFSSFLNSSTGNCAEDFDTLLAEFSKKSNVPPLVAPQPACNTVMIETTDYRQNDFGNSLLKQNPVAYVAGYLRNKCFKQHSCSECKKLLVTDNLNDNRNLLIFFKAYESNKSFGGLLNPTAHFLQYVEVLEDTFIANFSIYTKSDGIGKSILSKLEQVSAPFHCCEKFPKVFMQKLFLRMRIYYALKFANREFKQTKKKNRKYIKVTHL